MSVIAAVETNVLVAVGASLGVEELQERVLGVLVHVLGLAGDAGEDECVLMISDVG